MGAQPYSYPLVETLQTSEMSAAYLSGGGGVPVDPSMRGPEAPQLATNGAAAPGYWLSRKIYNDAVNAGVGGTGSSYMSYRDTWGTPRFPSVC